MLSTATEQQNLQRETQLGEEKYKQGRKQQQQNSCPLLEIIKNIYIYLPFGLFSGEVKYSFGTESDEEDLEAPLPLRSDEELRRLYNMRAFGKFITTKVVAIKDVTLSLEKIIIK